MLLKLRDNYHVPTGGWTFYVKEIDRWIRQMSKTALAAEVARALSVNEIPVPVNLPDIIEDQIARRCPESMRAPNQEDPGLSSRPITLSVVKTATQFALNAWVKNGRKLATIDEAIRRSDICIDCHMNSTAAACASCHGLRDWIGGYIDRPTPLTRRLYVCRVTAIMNMAIVHLPDAAVIAATNGATIAHHPPTCWKVPILEGSFNDRQHSASND